MSVYLRLFEQLRQVVQEECAVGDRRRLAAAHRELEAFSKHVTALKAEVAKAWRDAGGPRKEAFDGVGVVELHGGPGSKRGGWDRGRLVSVMVARAKDERRFDPETGEAQESEGDCVARVLDECFRMEPRLGAIRARGVDPDQFCERDDGPWSLKITASGSAF